MKKFITASLVVLAVVIGGVLATQTVSAQTANQSVRCSVAQNRLNTRITQVNTVKENHLTAFNNLSTKVETIITSAEAAGYDVTDLTTAFNRVDEKIAAFDEKATAYADALMATKNLSCGTSDSEFQTSLVAARAALTAARTASLDVRTVFTAEVITTLQDYSVWLKEQLEAEETK